MEEEFAWIVAGVALSVVLARVLLDGRVVTPAELPDGVLEGERRPFPPHVRMRGFASADFQDGGGYATDCFLGGKLTHLCGVQSDWSWRASDDSEPPRWARGALPFLYHRGNGASRWREADAESMRDVGANAMRLSLSWPKLQPHGPDTPFDERYLGEFVDHVAALRERGITVMCTLLHFVLPAWFAGWNATGEWQLECFARQVATRLPDLSDAGGEEWWITINEPTIYVIHSYILASRPPGYASFPLAVAVLASMLRAHVRMATAIRATRAAAVARLNVSMASNVVLFAPRNPWLLLDAATTFVVDMLFNRSVLALLLHGSTRIGPFLIEGEDREVLGEEPFIAINHYSRVTCSLLDTLELDHEAQADGCLPNDLNWDARIDYLHGVLTSITTMHPKARIVISEHGLPDEHDRTRPTLLEQTGRLLWSHQNVIGYFHWTFVDNVEWDIGIGARFGIVAVDYHTLRRQKRAGSAEMVKFVYGA